MKNLIAATLFFGFISTANAVFTDYSIYTTDSDSGLDWLDVSTTVNKSYNDITSQFGAGGLYEGWRYATGIEFNELVNNWTGKPSDTSNYGPRYFIEPFETSIDGLMQLLGCTFLQSGSECGGTLYSETLGIIADAAGGDQWVAFLQDFSESSSSQDRAQAHVTTFTKNSFSPLFGSYLVRETSVPETAALWLFVVGLLSLINSIKSKRYDEIKS